MNRIPLGTLALLAWPALAPAAIDFVDATPSNTTLADGTALNLVGDPPTNPEDYTTGGSSDTPDHHWHLRTGFGEAAAIWASQAGDSDNDSPMLRTTISGLTPGTLYDVYVYYWVAGFNAWPEAGGSPTGNNRWDIRAGLDEFTLADLGFLFGGSTSLEGLGDTGHFSAPVLTEEGNRRLHEAKVGVGVADGSGSLVVYVDDLANNPNRTWYEGVGAEISSSARWDGEGGDNRWSTAANWLGDRAPTSANELVFTGFDQAINQNDLAAGTSFTGITFDAAASAFEVSGNGITLSGDLVSQSAEFQTLDLPVALDGGRRILVSDAFGGVAIDGAVSGAHGLVKDGPGYLELAGANTYAGGLTVQAGSVYLAEDQTGATGDLVVGPQSNAPVTVTTDPFSRLRIGPSSIVRIGNTVASGTASPLLTVAGEVDNEGALYLGRAARLDIDTGSWRQSGPASLNGLGGYSCDLNILPDGVLDYSGGNAFQLNGAEGNSGQARLNVAGGTLRSSQGFEQGTLPTTGFGRLSLEDGGTLELTADVPVLTTGVALELGPGGGIIDSGAFAATTDAAISGAGSLTKAGDGSLTLAGACSYTGDTRVDAGTLQLEQAFLADEADVLLATGSTLVLAHGSTDPIDELLIDGVPQAAGIWGAPGSGAAHETPLIGGSGLLQVTSGAGAAGFASWASGRGLSGIPEDDLDGDGLADSVEYVLGTDPLTAGPAPIGIEASGDSLVLTFPRDDASETPDTSVAVEIGESLAAWPFQFAVGADTASSAPGVTVEENASEPDTVTITLSKAGSAALFGRLKVAINP